ncbi:MAG: VWA domain-containing protein [Candidatus Babeliales bacterium]
MIIAGVRLAYPLAAGGALVCMLIALLLRRILYKPATVRYAWVSAFIKHSSQHSSLSYQTAIPFALRMLAYCLLAVALGRPQRVDVESKVHVEGVDIMIALDASGSMQCFDDVKDRRTRFQVAKTEAIRFAQKRVNDQLGLILFGKEAVSRCPLTHDKRIIQEIIEKTELGIVDPDGTVLSVGLAMAINRLKNSKAKSKIVVLLTDGEPSPEFDIDPQIPIDLATKLGVRIYTVGIGGQEGGLINDPFFGVRPVGLKVNKALLERIAQQTGGKFFMAENADDMRAIYNSIDALEKTKTEAPLYTHYTELGVYCLMSALILWALMMIIQTFVWLSIS